MFCPNCECFKARVVSECHRVARRRDGTVRRVRKCGRCGLVTITLEWTKDDLDRRFGTIQRRTEAAGRAAERNKVCAVCEGVEVLISRVSAMLRRRRRSG